MADRFSATSEVGGITVKKFIKSRLGLSLNAMKKVKDHGAILINGIPATSGAIVSHGDLVEVVMPETGADSVAPENLDIPVIHEDDFVLTAATVPLSQGPRCIA